MDPKNILIVGVNGSVFAFQRDTGKQLWATHLKRSDFVNVVTDEKRVYAHTAGELYCIDLFTGDGVWSDPLKGQGFGMASLAGLGIPASVAPAAFVQAQQAASATAATTHS